MKKYQTQNLTEKSNVTFFRNLYSTCKYGIIYIGIFSCIVNILMLSVPIYMLQIFDRVIPSFSAETLLYLTLITILALLVLGALDIARSHILVRIAHWFDQKTSPEVIGKVPDEVIRGNISALLRIRDVPKIRNFLMSPALLTLFDLPWTPIFLVIIFLLHPALGLFSLVGAILLFSLGIFNHISTQKMQIEAIQTGEATQRQISQALRNAEIIQAMGMMPNLMQKWFINNEKSLSALADVGHKSGSFRAITKSLRLILQLGILGLGAYLVLQETITPGAMIAASILMSRALAPVEQSVASWRMMVEVKESYKNLKEYILQPAIRTGRMVLPKPKGKIIFENVYFTIPERKEYILTQINFSIDPGEFLVVYGSSAAGKTTLARIVMGIIKPTLGHARLDGADIYEWNREDFGTHVGYLPQAVELFNGSIKENIARMGKLEAEKVAEAAKFAGAHEMILQLPHGYETIVSDVSKTLSGGQLQRLALARAFYNNPKLIVLDEPDSNLDEMGHLALVESLKKAKENKTTIIMITHTLNLLKLADKVLILQNGRIVLFDQQEKVIEKLRVTVSAAQKQTNHKT